MVGCFNESNLFAARKTKPLSSRESPQSPAGTSGCAGQRRQPSTHRATGAWALAQLQACSLSRMSHEIESIFVFQLKHFTGVMPGWLSVLLDPNHRSNPTAKEEKRNTCHDVPELHPNTVRAYGRAPSLLRSWGTHWSVTATGLFTSTPWTVPTSSWSLAPGVPQAPASNSACPLNLTAQDSHRQGAAQWEIEAQEV